MSPTPRAGALLGATALTALVLPIGLSALLAVAAVTAIVVDALMVRRPPLVDGALPTLLARGIPAGVTFVGEHPMASTVEMRVPVSPPLRMTPERANDHLAGRVLANRRGRHAVPPVATRTVGPLRLGAAYHRVGAAEDIVVYPDVISARRLANDVRRGRFREAGNRPRGLGLGTEFETIRDYLPDDDVRQVNWRATARLGRPMSNTYRIEQDRDVMCVLDAGRLMAAPLDERTRLDAAVDATAAIGYVADQLGDRCGVIAFDEEIRRHVATRRHGGEAVVGAVFDLEPCPLESDYELAFRTVRRLKRSLVIVFTDLLEEAAARPLIDAMPLLASRHAVVIAASVDVDVRRVATTEPTRVDYVYRMAVALDVLADQRRVAALLARAGADVIEAHPDQLGEACVASYLRAKARARL